ncbi:MAG: DUF349 domain-containing protein [Thermomicrobiales bacterium]|nr:DUF349 domain-containing protein [Thermomicrobiales bacterium]
MHTDQPIALDTDEITDASLPANGATAPAEASITETAAETGLVVETEVATESESPDTASGVDEATIAETDASERTTDVASSDESPDVEPTDSPAQAEKPAPNPDVYDHRLIRDVFAAPHKVYLLGKVRKAAAAAGDSELAIHLKTVQADILHQVSERKSAKEALCERAEALKDSTAWKVTGDAFKALFEEWKQVGAAGRELDDQLWARFNAARGTFNERRAKHFEEREQVWAANREKKEALCERAEALADSTDWKATADAIRNLQAEWKTVGSAGREKDEALWARFNGAKQRFFDQRTTVWETNRARKAALVSDAEALKDSTDWRGAGDALKAMQAEWKNVGPAGREHEDELWTRFRAATQAFFDRRSSTFAERNKSERDNLAKKQELCVRAEALVYTGDSIAASREAKDLQAQWKEIGPVPREQSDALWNRFRQACDKIFENAHGERDRQQNEWHTRMREAMTRKREQLNSLRESISHDEANIERWRETLSSLKPGGKSDELGKSLEDKIIDVMDRIRGKQERVEDLRTSINDIEAKLRE